MQIDESRKLLLSDTLVPDIFVTELMPSLSGLAVKVYIFLLMTARNSRQTTEADLARRLVPILTPSRLPLLNWPRQDCWSSMTVRWN